MRRRRSKTADETDVDLTPMLDIVFIMLIFFIVTATFVRERGLDVLRPDDTDQPQQTRVSPIVIYVTAQNDIQVPDARATNNLRTILPQAVRANVERLQVDSPDAPVLIQADPGADMGVTLGVMDQARLANAASVSIATVE